jgi:hypothetical protein
VIVDSDFLKVGVEATLGRDHRVAAAVPESRALAAGMTDLCHSAGSLEGEAVTRENRPNICDKALRLVPKLAIQAAVLVFRRRLQAINATAPTCAAATDPK